MVEVPRDGTFPSREEAVFYVFEVLVQLRRIAEGAEKPFLVYLIEVAATEALKASGRE